MQFTRYIGIDEVGRGAWAGPVVLAAVCLNQNLSIPHHVYIRDSKALSRPMRERSDAFLRKNSTFCFLTVSRGTIDEYGVQKAFALGIQKIALKIKTKLILNEGLSNLIYRRRYITLIDGRRACDLEDPHDFIIGGDGKILAISAASILAKEYRDRYMRNVAAKRFPEYGFEKHVGYGTKKHQLALIKYGICNIHRRSYSPIKNLVMLRV